MQDNDIGVCKIWRVDLLQINCKSFADKRQRIRHWKKLSASGLKMYEIKDCHRKKPKQTKHKKYQANKQTTTKKKKKRKEKQR